MACPYSTVTGTTTASEPLGTPRSQGGSPDSRARLRCKGTPRNRRDGAFIRSSIRFSVKYARKIGRQRERWSKRAASIPHPRRAAVVVVVETSPRPYRRGRLSPGPPHAFLVGAGAFSDQRRAETRARRTVYRPRAGEHGGTGPWPWAGRSPPSSVKINVHLGRAHFFP